MLQLKEIKTPTPKDTEALIKVIAASYVFDSLQNDFAHQKQRYALDQYHSSKGEK